MAVVCNAIAFLHGFMWAQSPLPKMMPARVATFLVTVAFAAPGQTLSVRNPSLQSYSSKEFKTVPFHHGLENIAFCLVQSRFVYLSQFHGSESDSWQP